MKSLAIIAMLSSVAFAETVAVEKIVRDQVALSLPADLGVTKIFLPANLASFATDPSNVAIEVPRELRAGRSNVKVAVRGRGAVFVPVAIGKLVDVAIANRALAVGTVIEAGDITIERRAVDLVTAAVNSIVGSTVLAPVSANQPIQAKAVALPPPLARGTRVTLEMRRGSVRVRGSATLEASARPGDVATVRLAHTKTVVRGTLRAPSTVVVEENP